jgi:hypothetical protein
MATLALLRLSALCGEGRYRAAAERAMAPLVDVAARHPSGFAQWLLAMQLASSPLVEVAIVGEPLAQDTRALLAVALGPHHPGRVVALSPTPAGSVVPLLRGRERLEDRATAYVCRDFACQRPVTDAAALAEQLASASAGQSWPIGWRSNP